MFVCVSSVCTSLKELTNLPCANRFPLHFTRITNEWVFSQTFLCVCVIFIIPVYKAPYKIKCCSEKKTFTGMVASVFLMNLGMYVTFLRKKSSSLGNYVIHYRYTVYMGPHEKQLYLNNDESKIVIMLNFYLVKQSSYIMVSKFLGMNI